MKGLWTKASFDNTVSERELAHRRLARLAAAESIVLLENDGTLPLTAGPVALFGAGAAATIKGGTGSGEVNERGSVTIWEGLVNAGFTVTTEDWLNDYVRLLESERKLFAKAFFKKAQKAVFGGDDAMVNIMADAFRYPVGRAVTEGEMVRSGADTCIYVIARQAGECSDRGLDNYEYTPEPEEIANIKKVAAGYKKTIVVINVGSSIDMSALDGIEGINAVVYFCQQGMEGGSAFADIITGKVSPSGCLTNTWAGSYDDIPFAREYSGLKGGIDKEFYKEGIYVGYRYFDSFGAAPRYEFGYGLTYSDFTVGCAEAAADKSAVKITARVTNAGDVYSGKKVVQLYASCPDGKLKREYQSLAAFGKTEVLAPGESGELTLSFDLRELAGYDEESASYLLDAGDYILRLGFSSRDTRPAAVITLDETAVTEKCENVCPLRCGLEELAAPDGASKGDFGGVPRLSVRAADIVTAVHDYGAAEPEIGAKAAEWLKGMTTENMLDFVVGTGYPRGSRGFNLPGAAAFTTDAYQDRGICNIALCDGPAGLRAQRTAVVTGKGAVKPVDAMIGMFEHMPDFMKKRVLGFGSPDEGKLIYQYTTAFPVGTAMAQTWNTGILEAFGEAVGAEMEEYGAAFWLAPGMNIQRNPLCGRNYEYYSEDPLLTGKMAAAAVRGAQSREGCYATVKHYAANNQETKRNHSDSVVGERALREIYLKGFRLAVTEGGAKGLMTSYNMLNGVYTANSYDLNTKLLRNEWGFKGVVMSDWFATGKGMANNGLALRSGNDLIMPGGKAFMKRLKKDLKAGLVSAADISRCCANVLEAVANSRIQREFETRKVK